MDRLTIFVYGDLEFIWRMMQGVASLHSDNTMNQLAAALFGMFMLWSFIKWTISPEKSPYPAREMVLGIVLYMAFGNTPWSPKFNVLLAYDSQQYSVPPGAMGFREVDDVPALIVLPYWFTTHAFKHMRDSIRPFLNVPGAGDSFTMSGSSEAGTSPLHVLVRMHELSQRVVIDRHLERSIDAYMRSCFTEWYSLPGSPGLNSGHDLQSRIIAAPSLWASLALPPAANWLQTLYYDNDNPNGLPLNCISGGGDVGAFERIQARLVNYGNLVASELQQQGITSSDTNLAVSFLNRARSAADVNPFDLMTGMFVHQHIRSGLQGSNLGAWADKMVLEGGRKHVYERAGERNLFVAIMVPVITAIEAFAIFVGPIMILFTVLGGVGLGLIAKYLLLTVFIGLWGFIKIFTDWFTAVITLRAITHSPVNLEADPLTMGNIYQTMSELEFYLGVASSLTVAIPFFAMFMIYGGVHSMMGVMRTVGGGSVDGSNMAPTMATSMNAGTWSAGDTTQTRVISGRGWAESHNTGTHAGFGSNTTTTSVGTAADGARSLLRSRQEAESLSFQRSVEQMWGTNSTSSSTVQSQYGETSSQSRGAQFVDAVMDRNSTSQGFSRSDNTSNLARLAATLGAKAAVGSSGGAPEATKLDEGMSIFQSNPNQATMKKALMSIGVDAGLAGQLVAGLNQQQIESFAQQMETSQQNARQLMETEQFAQSNTFGELEAYMTATQHSDAYKEARNSAQTLQRLETAQTQLSQTATTASNSGTTYTEAWNATPMDYSAFESSVNALRSNDQFRERLDRIFGDNAEPFTIARELSNDNASDMQNGALMAHRLVNRLAQRDDDIADSALDAQMKSQLYRDVAGHASGHYKQSFVESARQSEQLANQLNGINSAHSVLGSVDTQTAQSIDDETFENKDIKPTNTNVNTAQASSNIGPAVPEPERVSRDVGQFAFTDDDRQRILDYGQGTDLSAIKQLAQPAANTFSSIASSASDFLSLFRGRDQRWGQDAPEIGQNLNSYASAQYGVQSLQLSQGMSELATMSSSDVNRLFSQLDSADPYMRLEAAQKISRMNDARLFMSSKEGANAVTQAFDEETGKHLVNNYQSFDRLLNSRHTGETPYSSNFFNAVSYARMNGDITDRQADTALKLVTGTAEAPIQARGRDDYRTTSPGDSRNAKSLAWMLNSSDSTFAASDQGRYLSATINAVPVARDYMNSHAPIDSINEYAPIARNDIITDATNASVISGRMSDTGDFTPGYNFADNQNNINAAPSIYARSLIESNLPVDAFNTSQLRSSTDAPEQRGFFQKIFGKTDSQIRSNQINQQEILFTAAAAPSNIPDRLGSAGFTNEAERVRSGIQNLQDIAPSYGVTLSRTELAQNKDNYSTVMDDFPSIREITGKR